MKLLSDLNQKRFRYGSYSIAVIIIFIAVVIALNMVVNLIPLSLDLTPNKQFSISAKTQSILKELDKDITIYVLIDEVEFRESYVLLDKLLDDYEANKYITIEYINAYRDPGAIKQLDPDNFYQLQSTNIFIVSGEKKKKLTMSDFTTTRTDYFSGESYDELAIEETLSGALMYITADKTPTIYFVQGHGEIALSDVSVLNEYLSRNNFNIYTINTLTAESIPGDADMLVFLSPTKDITIEERVKIQDFLDDNDAKENALMVFIDPMEQSSDFEQVNTLLETYNIRVNNDYVQEYDSEYYIPGSQYYLLPMYTIEGTKIFVPYARSISILQNKKEYISEEGILVTSTKAESEDIVTSEKKVGTQYVAVRTEYTGGAYPTRVFVIGNTMFLFDQAITNYEDNMQFMLDQIKWTLIQDMDTIYIPGKATVDTTLDITQKQATTISLALIILVPLILLGCGTIIYVRRKNL